MKDPNLKIREAYYALINGNVTYNGDPVPIYDEMVADSEGYPRIVISTQDATDWNCLDRYGHEHDITFEIVDKDRLGKKRMDLIANQLKPILFSNLDLSPDFALSHRELSGDLTFKLPTEDGTGQMFRQITIKLYLQEL